MTRRVFCILVNNVINELRVEKDIRIVKFIASKAYKDYEVIDCTNYDCYIGDIYSNGAFYHIDEDTGAKTELFPQYCDPDYKKSIENVADSYKERIKYLEKIIEDNHVKLQ